MRASEFKNKFTTKTQNPRLVPRYCAGGGCRSRPGGLHYCTMESAKWSGLPAELQVCILRMMYKSAWADRVAPFLVRRDSDGLVGWRKENQFQLGTRVKVVDGDPVLRGKVGCVIAFRAELATVVNGGVLLEVMFAPEDHPPSLFPKETLPFPPEHLERLGEPPRDERTTIVSNIAVLRRVSALFAQELRPLYLVSMLRRDVPIANAVAQFVRGMVQVSTMLGQGEGSGWVRVIYYEVHSLLYSTIEYICTSHSHLHQGVPDYLYRMVQIETAAALKRQPLASGSARIRVGTVRRIIRYFAYMDRYYCPRRGFACITDAIIDGPRRPLYDESRLERLRGDELATAVKVEAYPVPPGLLRPLSEAEAEQLPRNNTLI